MRDFAAWIKTLDELEPKGVQQETRLAPIERLAELRKAGRDLYGPIASPPVSRFSFSLAIVWLAGFYLMAAVCVGLVLYDLWLVFVS